MNARGAVHVLTVIGALFAAAVIGCRESRAQYVPNYFPTGVPGYDQELGVTVLSRQRPLYTQPGTTAGGFVIQPNLNETTGYNTNLLGSTSGSGSWLLETNPSITVNSDWDRNRLGASLNVDNQQYFGLPSQNLTNWTVALGGGYTIGQSDLTLAYSHVVQHELPTQVGSLPSETPVPFTIDNFRTDYTFLVGDLKITPNAGYSLLRYGSTTVLGQPVNQNYADANVAQAGVALSYGQTDERNLLLVLQGFNSNFINPQPSGPKPNSNSLLVMTGIDYRVSGVWRYQLLVGGQVSTYSAAQFKTQVEPAARADAIWTPTELTTVTGTLERSIQSPIQAGSSGFTYTSARLEVDHEILRNVVLTGLTGVSNVTFFEGTGGSQTIYSLGGNVTWLINRNVRLTGSYAFTSAHGGAASVGTTPLVSSLVTGPFTQNVFLLTLHFGI